MDKNLLYRYFTDKLTDAETKELMCELEQDDELQREYIELKKLNSLIDFTAQHDDKKIGAKSYARFIAKQKRPLYRGILQWRNIAKYAAVVCITLSLTYLMDSSIYRDQEIEEIKYFEFSTPSGQRAKMTLPDGSSIWLNARSTLRYTNQFSENNRNVELDGEGYFEIEHNPERPFIVSTNKANVKVLGTSFNISAYNDSPHFSASLVKGKIDVSLPCGEPNHNIILKPNQMVTIENHRFVLTELTDFNSLLWKDGVYIFNDLQLSEIKDKLELWYNVDIKIENKDLASYRFSGKFRQVDGVEGVLKVLSVVKHFEFSKNTDTNEITIY